MMDNQYYIGLMEGRFPFAIESERDPADPDMVVASFTDHHGTRIEARSTSAADAHNLCTQMVREAVREGSIVPER